MFAQPAEEKGLELLADMSQIHLSLMVRGDPFRMRQVISNLLSNAIKFTSSGEVILRVRQREETDSKIFVSLSVEDTGIGIPAEAQEKVFEHFAQADGSTTRKFGGTGLGLTICKRLVELMGGEISLESAAGQGSKFRIDIPLVKAQTVPLAPSSVGSLKGANILVVDDNRTNLEILQHQLESWDMRTSCAETGEQALWFMAREAEAGTPFNLAILDMHMPQIDGLQLARRIKAQPALASTRLIMLTSTHDAGTSVERAQAGILRCISKPIRQSELFDVIRTVVSGSADIPVPDTPPAPDAAESLQPGQRGKVLLAEDNPVNQMVAKAMLERLGVEVEIAGNGEEALALVDAQHFDLVLMDCQMPLMDGYQATAAIRQRQAGNPHHLPIIALTANAMEEDRNKCLAAGMDDYLSKPYAFTDLERMMTHWLRPATRDPVATTSAFPASEHENALNMQFLKQFQELDPSGGLIRNIMQAFLDNAEDTILQIEQAVAAEDAEGLRRSAHTLKSSSANVGAEKLSALFRQLEALGREGKLGEAKSLLGEMQQAHEHAAREIRALLGSA
jgi:CheY-like chemotaxis protein